MVRNKLCDLILPNSNSMISSIKASNDPYLTKLIVIEYINHIYLINKIKYVLKLHNINSVFYIKRNYKYNNIQEFIKKNPNKVIITRIYDLENTNINNSVVCAIFALKYNVVSYQQLQNRIYRH